MPHRATPDRRVLFLYTGGTIGMQETPGGLAPQPGQLLHALASMPQICDPGQAPYLSPPTRMGARIQWELEEFSPPLDSVNMGIADWRCCAETIVRRYDDFDAFVVLHGTDTMAYTASALSFMLQGLDKTVVVTGSQIPLSHVRNDAVDNLIGALSLAGHFDIPEVCLYFRGKLWRGNRVQKVDASGLEAFEAGNMPPLATVGVDIEVRWDRVRPASGGGLRYVPIRSEGVLSLRLFPGLSADTLRRLLEGVEGLVLETYGAGNAPDNRPEFLEALREATERGVVVVSVTQCHRGAVSSDYASGRALSMAGVVSGGDMTPEAALTKLAWLLSQDLGPDEVRRRMKQDLRGELTETSGSASISSGGRALVERVARSLAGAGPEEAQRLREALRELLDDPLAPQR